MILINIKLDHTLFHLEGFRIINIVWINVMLTQFAPVVVMMEQIAIYTIILKLILAKI